MTDAHAITAALGGLWKGNSGMACCPVHDDRSPSLSIRDGDDQVLVHCFAGCDRRDIIAELRRRGLIEGRSTERALRPRPAPRPPEHKPDPHALEIWRAGTKAPGSIVEPYLRNRNITLEVPLSLRCGTHWHLNRFPMATMIAGVQAPDGTVIACQETLLTPKARRATVALPRITTGALGAGAVRLAKAGAVLGLAEGVETALSAMQISGIPCWACLGAARMHRVAIPDWVRELHVFGDNDDAGHQAADRTVDAHKRIRVVVCFPLNGEKDWNDVQTNVATPGHAA
jgi:hypothetical protein